jgi:hypothetical protein
MIMEKRWTRTERKEKVEQERSLWKRDGVDRRCGMCQDRQRDGADPRQDVVLVDHRSVGRVDRLNDMVEISVEEVGMAVISVEKAEKVDRLNETMVINVEKVDLVDRLNHMAVINEEEVAMEAISVEKVDSADHPNEMISEEEVGMAVIRVVVVIAEVQDVDSMEAGFVIGL